MFFNFTTILILSTMIYAFRFMDSLEIWGDKLNLAMRIFPSYMLADSIYFDQGGQTLADFRNRKKALAGTVNPDPYQWENNTSNFVLSAVHFIGWTLVLVAIESDLAWRAHKWFTQKFVAKMLPAKNETLQLDEDVVAEAERVSTF